MRRKFQFYVTEKGEQKKKGSKGIKLGFSHARALATMVAHLMLAC